MSSYFLLYTIGYPVLNYWLSSVELLGTT